MPRYLEGFNDGYKKALEEMGRPLFKVTMDSKELAEIVYEDVTRLQEKDRLIKSTFNAE